MMTRLKNGGGSMTEEIGELNEKRNKPAMLCCTGVI